MSFTPLQDPHPNLSLYSVLADQFGCASCGTINVRKGTPVMRAMIAHFAAKHPQKILVLENGDHWKAGRLIL